MACQKESGIQFLLKMRFLGPKTLRMRIKKKLKLLKGLGDWKTI